MLMLSRKAGESIQITTSEGQEITVQVCKIEDSQVKVGIQEPTAIKELRAELAS